MQYNLGLLMLKGLAGVTKDPAEAAKWIEKSAEQGYPPAQFKLGQLYSKGHGVMQDYAKTASWWRAAADQDYAPAQTGLGFIYEKGQSVDKNYIDAISWYRKAANQGDFGAEENITNLYILGEGTFKNDAEAYFWVSIAAAKTGSKPLIAARDSLAAHLSIRQRGLIDKRIQEWKPTPSQTTMMYAKVGH